MLKILKRLLPILGLLFLLAGCEKPLDTKQQVKDDLNTILQISKTQQTALSTLEDAGQGVPDSYLKIQAKYPDQNLLDVKGSKIAQTAASRAEAYKTLKTQQAELKPVVKRLIKIANQESDELPIEFIKDLNQSLKLSALDYTTLSNFYDAAATAETDFYADHTSADAHADDLAAPINRLNQYYSAIYQQAEIAKVNINTVTAQAKKVQKQLD
ncbi:hypothetical protein ACPBEH_09580 [Latilactobacillus sp. 5-91]|uniref:hypothetical protein n=1 Tax=Latilactobacillus TaxID=2767885 RepID=UPI003884E013